MQFKRAKSIIFFFEQENIIVYNYITHNTISCNKEAIQFLSLLNNWLHATDLMALLGSFRARSAIKEIKNLILNNLIIVHGTSIAEDDEKFIQKWQWGHLCGFFHFGTKYGKFIPANVGDALQRERAKINPSPSLYTTNEKFQPATELPKGVIDNLLYETMERRRSNRLFSNRFISVESISDCLYFSMSITKILLNPEIANLPLKMTPSGGARNPFEAYVCIRKVKGLNTGVYHYSALEHSLGEISLKKMPKFVDLCGDQKWTNNASAIIFLVANFERPMWKYRDPYAYRVVLIEAGHIGQNIMLTATRHGLAANPTGAFNEQLIEETLKIDKISQSTIYALAIGFPKYEFEWMSSGEIR